MPVTRLEDPYTETEILESLTPLTKGWFQDTFATFSPPQRYSILNIKKRKNTLISSPTGSGKTLSAFLAILDDLIHYSQDGTLEDRVYCLYISPLKALGNDIEKNLERPLRELQDRAEKDLGIRVGVRTGDTTPYERQKMLKQPPHILITTPESLSIMLTSPKFSLLLHDLDWVVIDEIHALADNKRGTQLSLAMERLAERTYFTRIGLSATVSPLEEVGRFLVGQENGESRPCDIVDVMYEKKLDIKVMSPVQNLIGTTHAHLQEAQYDMIDELVQQHKTTLIFTNTRAATERVVHQLRKRYPSNYTGTIEKVDDASEEEGEVRTTIAAHHGSLSKEHRLRVEQQLRDGKLRCVVSSTSLELGIDIGYVDLVILLGSPKSVARALQRIGRSGHKLHETAKGRIIVLDRDDLVECSVLARAALARRIDRIHIPRGALDVLAQEIFGTLVADKRPLKDVYTLMTRAYPFTELTYQRFMSVVKYLAGEYAELEDRHVYAKIWYDENDGMAGRKGRMARVIYSTNVGTIPDQTDVIIKIGEAAIGSISEPFLESLKPGDVFVLGGDAYEYRYSRGMTAQVVAAQGKRPTVPSWFSEMLPLSFDLALEVQEFRKHMQQLLSQGKSQQEIMKWLGEYLPIDSAAEKSIAEYFKQQYLFSQIPHRNKILIEHFTDGHTKYIIFHSLFGRRVNDVLSRAVAYALGKMGSGDIEIGLSDNGFYLRHKHTVQARRALSLLHPEDIEQVMRNALEKTEVLRRRFRHCAGRSLMILRSYKGSKKSVGRQQVSSQLLITAVKRIGEDFPIYEEAKREVLEDLMDVHGAKQVLSEIERGRITVEEVTTDLPSPFSFSLVLQGYADVMRMEERQEFIHRLHKEMLAKLSLKRSRTELDELTKPTDFHYEELWEQEEMGAQQRKEDVKLSLKEQLYRVARKEDIPAQFVYETQRLIEGDGHKFSQAYIDWLTELLSGTIPKGYGDELVILLKDRLPELNWR